ncbi:hypothetical protein GLAREA_07140 [Glarea lozoyensis ATCC 20868]|uniref:Uncharacterized protein n=1 Tax=Glarea lozoyensis (strain ATCC 20868 / MF5171) TaxID=1116229 RepID=S3D6K3_GLAL2|nr:uncharacterized protein GLAREA_07140 [Glarea lozoyensis ATCC 20868]EPE34127.1 hypothetical protein GLAREA_07140 [Glarea lozoyensis ATCC 20868]
MAQNFNQQAVNDLMVAISNVVVAFINQTQAASVPAPAPPPASQAPSIQQEAQLAETVNPNQHMGKIPPSQRRRLQEPAVINSYRNLQGPNFIPPFRDEVIQSREELRPGDREALEDLAVKIYGKNHPVGEIPDEQWVTRWEEMLFVGNWKSSIEPVRPTLQKKPRVESWIQVGVLAQNASRGESQASAARRKGAPVYLRITSFSPLGIAGDATDAKAQLVPEELVEFSDTKEKLLARAAFHYSELETSRFSEYNKLMIRYQARMRLYFWLHSPNGERHGRVPEEENFELRKPRYTFEELQRRAANAASRHYQGTAGVVLVDEVADGEPTTSNQNDF